MDVNAGPGREEGDLASDHIFRSIVEDISPSHPQFFSLSVFLHFTKFWLWLDVLLCLYIVPFLTPLSRRKPFLVNFMYLLVGVGINYLLHASAVKIREIELENASLRGSIQSAREYFGRASDVRNLRGTTLLDITNGVPKGCEGNNLFGAVPPKKIVEYVDPIYLAELDLKRAQRFNMLREVAEKADRLDGRTVTKRPPWVEDGLLCVVCHKPFGPEGAHLLGTCGHAYHPPCLLDYSRKTRHCFCDVPIHSKYYMSTGVLESKPVDMNQNHKNKIRRGNRI